MFGPKVGSKAYEAMKLKEKRTDNVEKARAVRLENIKAKKNEKQINEES